MNGTAAPPPGSSSSSPLQALDPTSYSPMRAAVITLSVCAFLGAVVTAAWIAAGRNRFEVRLTQPGTTFACFFSLAMLNGGIILGVKTDKSAEWCVARVWTVQLSMAMVLACNFMKAGRLFVMDRSASASPLRISEERFFLFLVVYMFLHAFCLGYWTFFEPLTVSPQWGEPVCVSQGWIGQVSALCSLAGIWFVWLYWAVATNHLGSRLTETAWLSAVVVGLAALTGGVAAGYLSPGSIIVSGPVLFTQESRLLAESVCGFVVTLTLIWFVVHPKLANQEGLDEMISDIERRRAEKRRRGSALTSKSSRSSLTTMSSSTTTPMRGRGSSLNSLSPRAAEGSGGEMVYLPEPPPQPKRPSYVGGGGVGEGGPGGGAVVPRIDENDVWEDVV